MRWVWIGVVVSTIAAVFVGIVLISKAETSVQETTAVATAIAIAVIPYVFARACEKFLDESDENE